MLTRTPSAPVRFARLTCAELAMILAAGCATGGHGLDAGPAGAAQIGIVRTTSTSVQPGGSVETRSNEARDYPVDLTELISVAVHDDRDTAVARTFPRASVLCIDKASGNQRIRIAPAVCEAGEVTARTFDPSTSLELARKFFYDNCPSADRCGVLRDRVQDRLIWASESACAAYMTDVRKSFTSTNLNLGSLTTVFGALGSIFTSADAARIFAGSAGATSGLRAEYNDVYFSSQAFELVSKAIRSLREKTIKRIYDARKNTDIRAYTLDAAIADAMKYHATCNVMAGLEEAAEAVTRDRDPGLKRLGELLQDVGAGTSVSLGTAALDTSSLPSAGQSCRRLDDAVKQATALQADLDAAVTKLQGGDATLLAAAQKRQADGSASLKQLTSTVAPMSQICSPPDTGAVAVAEKDMYDAVRAFAAAPLSDKAARKAAFDAARAKVLELKVQVDQVLATASSILEKMVAVNKT